MIELLVACVVPAVWFPAVQEGAPREVASATVDVEAVRGRLQALMGALVEERGLPGASAALAFPDGTVVAAAAGFASKEEGRKLGTDGRFLAGSVGKSYVAATAMELVLAGELDLDERARSYLTEEEREWFDRLPNARDFTVRHLLRHESGMDRYELRPDFWQTLLSEPDRRWTPRELLERVAGEEPLFAAGEGWNYADTNYIALGVVLERRLGGSIVEHVKERFLVPNGLRDTVPSEGREIAGLVQGYAVSTRGLGVPERVLGEDGRFVFDPQFEGCGGGWASTPSDLARWARLWYGGRLFAVETGYVGRMLESVEARGLGPGRRYGLGVIVTPTERGELRGHEGFMTGYLSAMGVFVESGIAVAFQTNTDDLRAVGRLEGVLVRVVGCVGG